MKQRVNQFFESFKTYHQETINKNAKVLSSKVIDFELPPSTKSMNISRYNIEKITDNSHDNMKQLVEYIDVNLKKLDQNDITSNVNSVSTIVKKIGNFFANDSDKVYTVILLIQLLDFVRQLCFVHLQKDNNVKKEDFDDKLLECFKIIDQTFFDNENGTSMEAVPLMFDILPHVIDRKTNTTSRFVLFGLLLKLHLFCLYFNVHKDEFKPEKDPKKLYIYQLLLQRYLNIKKFKTPHSNNFDFSHLVYTLAHYYEYMTVFMPSDINLQMTESPSTLWEASFQTIKSFLDRSRNYGRDISLKGWMGKKIDKRRIWTGSGYETEETPIYEKPLKAPSTFSVNEILESKIVKINELKNFTKDTGRRPGNVYIIGTNNSKDKYMNLFSDTLYRYENDKMNNIWNNDSLTNVRKFILGMKTSDSSKNVDYYLDLLCNTFSFKNNIQYEFVIFVDHTTNNLKAVYLHDTSKSNKDNENNNMYYPPNFQINDVDDIFEKIYKKNIFNADLLKESKSMSSPRATNIEIGKILNYLEQNRVSVLNEMMTYCNPFNFDKFSEYVYPIFDENAQKNIILNKNIPYQIDYFKILDKFNIKNLTKEYLGQLNNNTVLTIFYIFLKYDQNNVILNKLKNSNDIREYISEKLKDFENVLEKNMFHERDAVPPPSDPSCDNVSLYFNEIGKKINVCKISFQILDTMIGNRNHTNDFVNNFVLFMNNMKSSSTTNLLDYNQYYPLFINFILENDQLNNFVEFKKTVIVLNLLQKDKSKKYALNNNLIFEPQSYEKKYGETHPNRIKFFGVMRTDTASENDILWVVEDDFMKTLLRENSIPEPTYNHFVDRHIFLYSKTQNIIFARPMSKNENYHEEVEIQIYDSLGENKISMKASISNKLYDFYLMKHTNNSFLRNLQNKYQFKSENDDNVSEPSYLENLIQNDNLMNIYSLNDRYIFYFQKYDISKSKHNKLVIEYDQKEDKYYFKNYEILTEKSNVKVPLNVSRWFYDIYEKLVLYDKKSMTFKVLMIYDKDVGTMLIDKVFKSMWVEPSIEDDFSKEIKSMFITNYGERFDKCFTFSIGYNGVNLIFDNSLSYCYFLLNCISLCKTKCTYDLMNQMLYFLEKKDRIITDSEEEEDAKINEIQIFIVKMIGMDKPAVSHPYRYYFKSFLSKNIPKDNNEGKVDLFRETHYRIYYYPTLYQDALYKKKYAPANDSIDIIKEYKNVFALKNYLYEETEGAEYDDSDLNGLSDTDFASIKGFLDTYRKCELKDRNPKTVFNWVNSQNYIDVTRAAEEVINLSQDKIYSILHYDQYNHFSEIVLNPKNTKHFYNLLVYRLLLNTIKFLEKICLSKECNCEQLKDMIKSIDDKIVYTGERNNTIILFEILSGFLIRKSQQFVYSNIERELIEKGNYKIYEMLMGAGKTAVITPLLIISFLENEYFRKYRNIILTLPDHLTQQSFDSFKKTLMPLLTYRRLFDLKITRNDKDGNVEYKNFFKSHPSNYIDREEENLIYKNIIVINDTSLKSILLNDVITAESDSDSLTNIVRNNSIVIMDEIDSLADPLSSDLNFPIQEGRLHKENIPAIEKVKQHFVVNVIKYLILENTKVKGEREIHFSKIEDSYLFCRKTFDKYYETFRLLTSYEKEYDYFYKKYVTNKSPDVDKKHDYRWDVVEIFNKTFATFIFSMTNIYKKNYGFGNNVKGLPKNFHLAIPYKAQNDPIDRSQFSDVELLLILTSFSYFYNGLRKEDFISLIKYCKKVLVENKGSDILIRDVVTAFEKKNVNLPILLNENLDEIVQNEDYYAICKNNDEIIDFYVKNIVFFEYVAITTEQYNASFIDISKSKFSTVKAGFTGTPNMLLPCMHTYKDNQRVCVKDEINEFVDFEYSQKFNDSHNGGIISAFLGMFDSNRGDTINVINVNDPEFFEKDIIEGIIFTGGHNALIDSGAFFRKYNSEQLVKKIVQVAIDRDNGDYKHRKYIYVKNKKKYVYEYTEKGEELTYNYSGEIYDTNEVFMYYDNKNIVGTDIPQPSIMNGLVTINYFNRSTEVSQAMFRLRKLNFGHSFHFVLNKDVFPNMSKQEQQNLKRVDILKYLNDKEHQYKLNTESKERLQKIKYYKRAVENNINSYKEKLFFKQDLVKHEDDLEKNLYSKFIQQYFCK